MTTTLLLAVDTAHYEPGRHVTAAIEMVRDLAAKTGDKVVVVNTGKDLPSITFGSVASRLLHLSRRPVLIVPMHQDPAHHATTPGGDAPRRGRPDE
jgi:nucleotide-binding universal stress UspA family protein